MSSAHASTAVATASLYFEAALYFFRIAASVNLLADLLVAAAPVVELAGRVAVSGLAPHTTRGAVGQGLGAGGAVGESEHSGAAVTGGRSGVLYVELAWSDQATSTSSLRGLIRQPLRRLARSLSSIALKSCRPSKIKKMA